MAVGAGGWWGGGVKEAANGHRAPLWGDGNILELSSGDGGTTVSG